LRDHARINVDRLGQFFFGDALFGGVSDVNAARTNQERSSPRAIEYRDVRRKSDDARGQSFESAQLDRRGVQHFARNGATAPSERVCMGFIGLGGQGSGHLLGGAWTYVPGGYVARDDVQVLAVCDVRKERRESAQQRCLLSQAQKSDRAGHAHYFTGQCGCQGRTFSKARAA
jgi:hypothetical protein